MIGVCSQFLTSAGGLAGALLLAGLMGGFSHCAGMCGPFVLAQVPQSSLSGPVFSKLSRAALVSYHLGRMTTYIALAVLTNTVLNLAFAATPLKALIAAPMLLLAGVIFLVSAFPGLSAVFPWAARANLLIPYRWFSGIGRTLTANPGVLKRYFLGVLLGFLPCGLVFSALLAASTAGNAVYAAMAMGAFALGTVPALMLTALGGNMFRTFFPRVSSYAFRGLMAFNGLWLIAMAGFSLRAGN